MRILHLGFSDTNGGAAQAMMRIHNSLLDLNIDSNVLVAEKLTKNRNVFSSNKNFFEKYIVDFKIKLARQKKFFFNSSNGYSHSLNIFKSNILKKIDEINPDIINLHWINNELISIKQLSKIKRPMIWTMMDMWPMCGGEHYTDSSRYIDGYKDFNRDPGEKGFDLNKWLWDKKIKYLKNNPKTIICISDWLQNKTKKSFLFKNTNITKINPSINNNVWKPIDKNFAKKKLDIPLDKKVLLFFSTNGINDKRKGYEFVEFVSNKSSSSLKDFIVLIVDKDSLLEKKSNQIKFKEKLNFGDTEKLRLIYSSSDILLAPSRLEAFGQVAIEAASCGKPCIGFNNTGLEDAIHHKVTGYLAEYLDRDDFNNGFNWALEQILKNDKHFHNACIKFVNDNFSPRIISQKYLKIYNKTLE